MMTNARLARNFRALAHPRRAMLFRLLAERPQLGTRQDALMHAAGLGWGSFSHHMRILEACGLVAHRRRGPNVAYALTAGELGFALETAGALAERARRDASRAPRRAA
jgi:DNA-binding transcriptional ArsR family regulator